MANEVKKQDDLTAILWRGADILRSKMDANDYKEYLLPVLFYKYLSDKILDNVNSLLTFDTTKPSLEEMHAIYEKAYADENTKQMLRDELMEQMFFVLEPQFTYTNLIQTVKENKFQRELLAEAFKEIESCGPVFEGLFSNVDLYSPNLGITPQKQSDTIVELLLTINEANLLEYSGDAIGDAYEYMIAQFASETGKKAGEFYTPKAVSEILTRIAISGQESKKGLTVYDPCMGSASLLMDAVKFSDYPAYVKHCGQEVMPTTYNLARMNMILHGISPENQNLRNGDTLDADWPPMSDTGFDMVVMNPPYSQAWSAVQGFKQDPRFRNFDGNLAPKSKADYAFLLHGYYHLKNTGTMGIVLPHGVLFRGGSEEKIRKILCEKGAIYAVIGLPANLFYSTGIPTIIMILKKNRESTVDRDILFIDASHDFEKVKTQNVLRPEHITAIVDMYKERKDVDKKAHLASFEEIEKNEFNLNIPRYVDTSEEEEEVDISSVVASINEIDSEINKLNNEIYAAMQELASDDKELLNQIHLLADLFKSN